MPTNGDGSVATDGTTTPTMTMLGGDPSSWHSQGTAMSSGSSPVIQTAASGPCQYMSPPVNQHPVIQQPVIQQPVIQQPVIQQPVIQQPVSHAASGHYSTSQHVAVSHTPPANQFGHYSGEFLAYCFIELFLVLNK